MHPPAPKRIERYLTENGSCPFDRWLKKYVDAQTRGAVRVRLARIEETGNLGDWAPTGDGVMELRFHGKQGHRIYFGFDGDTIVLLGGGDKNTQADDIKKAKHRWSDYNA